MKPTYSIKEAQKRLSYLIRKVEAGGVATITRDGKTVAYLLGAKTLGACIETMDLLSNPVARRAIADAEADRGRVYSLDEIAD